MCIMKFLCIMFPSGNDGVPHGASFFRVRVRVRLRLRLRVRVRIRIRVRDRIGQGWVMVGLSTPPRHLVIRLYYVAMSCPGL